MTTSILMIAAFLMLPQAPVARAADVSGAWTVTIRTAQGTITGEASLKQTGRDVSGTIGPSGDATIAIAGVLEGRALTLTTNPRPGRTAAFRTCRLTVGAAKMTGTLQGGDVGKGTIVRSKS